MTIDASCPNCGTIYTVRRELIGKRTKCTRCGAHFVIAEAPAAAPPPTREPVPSPQEVFAGIPTHLPPPAHTATPTTPPPRQERASELFGFEHDVTRPKFQAMRTVAKLYQICGFIVLFIAACGFVAFLVEIIREPQHFWINTIAFGTCLTSLLMTALFLFFASQSIHLWLHVEQNTRESAQACRQLAEHLCAIQVDK